MKQSLSYITTGEVPVIAQPKSMACWATVAAMLISWKKNLSFTVESAMDSLGGDFRSIFESNTGLSPDRVADFTGASGLTVEYQKCESPDSIYNLLVDHGPIIVIDDEDESANFAIHARVVRSISGDGDPENILLGIIDPEQGQVYDEPFTKFAAKYEAMADASGWNLQIMHY